MKFFTLSTALISPLFLDASEMNDYIPEIEWNRLIEIEHKIVPHFFYRYHKEGRNTYKTSGMGFHYEFHQREGLNFKFGVLSNLSKKNSFMDSFSHFQWKFPKLKWCQFYTGFESHMVSQLMKETELEKQFSHKFFNITTFGMNYNHWNSVHPFIELGAIKDSSNLLISHMGPHFKGREFYNPYGGKVKIGMETFFSNGVSFLFESHYAHTEKNCYKDFGTEISFKWSF